MKTTILSLVSFLALGVAGVAHAGEGAARRGQVNVQAAATKAVVAGPAVVKVYSGFSGAKVFVVYGDHGTPGSSVADVIGHDAYPKLVASAVKPGQQQWLFAGGSDPWRVDPTAAGFVDYCKAHPEVFGICAFTWLDGWGGTTNKGIRSNGMADKYRAAAIALRNATV